MNFFRWLTQPFAAALRDLGQRLPPGAIAAGVALLLVGVLGGLASPAWAALQDDRFDGNIFALYAGNGSLVPPRTTLALTLSKHKPAVVSFYVDDSRDCKQFSLTLSRLQSFYGQAAEFLPIAADSLLGQPTNDPRLPAHYFGGTVPQTVILNQAGKVVLNEAGQVPFEKMDDVLREVFDLLPRSQSETLRRRPLNEVNDEFVLDPRP